jgi:hypothetical protein
MDGFTADGCEAGHDDMRAFAIRRWNHRCPPRERIRLQIGEIRLQMGSGIFHLREGEQ